jgi:hypothetical protein
MPLSVREFDGRIHATTRRNTNKDGDDSGAE